MIYDAIIIGGGPAGLTAGIYASRAGKKVVLIENYAIGGQIALSHEVENYSGHKKISGVNLTETMREQAESFGTEFVYDNIVRVQAEGEIKKVETEYSGSFQAEKLILAMGAKARPLGLPNEGSLVGRGVSYCATCDGNFFKGKTVTVAGGGDTALTDALYLSRLAKKVYIVHRRDEYRGSKILADRVKAAENIEEVLSHRVTELRGAPLAEIEVESTASGTKKTIQTDGLFVAVGNLPQTSLVEGQIALENGYIPTDEDMKTNVDGVFAVGDIRKKLLRQVVTACADGAIAGFQV